VRSTLVPHLPNDVRAVTRHRSGLFPKPFANAQKSSAAVSGSSACFRISRCSASAERPCSAARILSRRMISSSTLRTVSWPIAVVLACISPAM
jgi:hypothetical protein